MKHTEKHNDNFDKDFEAAYKLCVNTHTHSELLDMLNSGNIAQKQISALKFDVVQNEQDVHALLSNLTGCDGKIREAVAFKINSLLFNDEVKKLFAPHAAKVFAQASIDINANICRLVVDSALMLKEFDNFSKSYTDYILKFIQEALAELDKFIFRDKKYVINKQLFKLYWSLEALNNFCEYVDEETLKEIIIKCSKQEEYTIREKIALILSNTNINKEVKELLTNDENYYVKQILHHPSTL